MPWSLDTVTDAERLANYCRGIADAKRLQLLAALRKGETSVGDLASSVGLSQPSVSHHLGVLRKKGLVEVRREGSAAFYRIDDKRIVWAVDALFASLEGVPFSAPPAAPDSPRAHPPAPPPLAG